MPPVPTWLSSLVEQLPALGSVEALAAEKEGSDYSGAPWPVFVEQKLMDQNIPATRLMEFFLRKFPALLPASLESAEIANTAEVFNDEFIEKFNVVPFNAAPPFLALAVIDPDMLSEFYPVYVGWAKTNQFSLLQYFITLPSDFRSYLERRNNAV